MPSNDDDRLCLSLLINSSKQKVTKEIPQQQQQRDQWKDVTIQERQILQQCIERHVAAFMNKPYVQCNFDHFVKLFNKHLETIAPEIEKTLSGKID